MVTKKRFAQAMDSVHLKVTVRQNVFVEKDGWVVTVQWNAKRTLRAVCAVVRNRALVSRKATRALLNAGAKKASSVQTVM